MGGIRDVKVFRETSRLGRGHDRRRNRERRAIAHRLIAGESERLRQILHRHNRLQWENQQQPTKSIQIHLLHKRNPNITGSAPETDLSNIPQIYRSGGLSSCVLSPAVLSPAVLSPAVLSPAVLSLAVLSPGVLSSRCANQRAILNFPRIVVGSAVSIWS